MWLVKNPTVHFVTFGALLYWLLLDTGDTEIELHHLRLESARRAMQASLGVTTLNAEQRLETDLRVVGDELFYREALSLGLDSDDHIVRQRLVQKLLFLVEDASAGRQDDQALRDYYDAHRAHLLEPVRISFEHVYLREANADRQQRIETSLNAAELMPTELGDRFPLPNAVVDAALEEVHDNFGKTFADTMKTLALGQWHGPLTSRFGLHFVRVNKRTEERPLSFEESRKTVEERLIQQEKRRAHRQLIQRLAKKFRISVDADAPQTYRDDLVAALASIRAGETEER